MQELYYTPTPEDFRRGFEFEFFYPNISKWNKEVFDGAGHSFCCTGKIQFSIKNKHGKWEDHVRVPYLTADQIESEEWTQQINRDIYFKASNGLTGYRIYTDLDLHTIEVEMIVMDSEITVYNGPCRCINDFRLICKLLNITQ